MTKVEIIKEGENPALELSAANAVGGPTVANITWEELKTAPVGHQWGASGGGSLFYERYETTLVHRDEDLAVVVLHWHYAEDDQSRCADETTLYTFRFAKGIHDE